MRVSTTRVLGKKYLLDTIPDESRHCERIMKGRTLFIELLLRQCDLAINSALLKLMYITVMSRVHQENFPKFTNWIGACDMKYERTCWSNRRAVRQDGLVVMRWDFWLVDSRLVVFITGDASLAFPAE